jgi:hypothetical protein
VTIRQILSLVGRWSPGDDLLIDGVIRKIVSIVGLIRSSRADGIATIYEIDDGTGIIKVADLTEDNPLEAWIYCRVVGRLQLNDEEGNPISAFSVRPVTDYNQIPYHMLQALYVHLHVSQGPPKGSAFAAADHPNASPVRQSAAAAAAPASISREELADQAVLRILNKGNKQDGTPRQEIIAGLAREFSVQEVDEAIGRLTYRSEIYPGGDDRFCSLS